MITWLRSCVARLRSGGPARPAPAAPPGRASGVTLGPSPFVDLGERGAEPRPAEVTAADAGADLAGVLRDTLDTRLAGLRGSGGTDADIVVRGLTSGQLDTAIRQLPSAARQVMDVMHSGDPDLNRLAELVDADPALSQSLLQHANSAWYTRRFGAPASSVKLALQRVGTRGLEATVMARSLEGALSRPGHGFALMERMVWDHMVRVAGLAREMSVGRGMDPDRLYTLGLVHDVGKLVVFNQISDRRRALRRELDLHPVWVGDLMRAVHEPLGGLALLSWGMDARDAWAVAAHHADPPPPELPEVALLATAERMDLSRADGEPEGAAAPPVRTAS